MSLMKEMRRRSIQELESFFSDHNRFKKVEDCLVFPALWVGPEPSCEVVSFLAETLLAC